MIDIIIKINLTIKKIYIFCLIKFVFLQSFIIIDL